MCDSEDIKIHDATIKKKLKKIKVQGFMCRYTTDGAREICDYTGTAISVQAWTFLEGSWRLRLPDCKKIGTRRW